MKFSDNIHKHIFQHFANSYITQSPSLCLASHIIEKSLICPCKGQPITLTLGAKQINQSSDDKESTKKFPPHLAESCVDATLHKRSCRVNQSH
jgi:hypothetical protein